MRPGFERGIGVILLVAIGCSETTQPVTAPAPSEQQTAVAPQREHGFLGIQFEDVESRPMVISGTVPGSGAADVGIQQGDLLLQIEDVPHPGLPEIFEILNASSPGDELAVVVKRDTTPRRLQIPLVAASEIEEALDNK